MGRQQSIARSIALAINDAKSSPKKRGFLGRILAAFAAFFTFYQLLLEKWRAADFGNLRRSHWNLKDEDYVQSFLDDEDESKGEQALSSIGDMGFSGSTFYATRDGKILVKSIPRRSEYSFFRDELLTPYAKYMASHPTSLLVRILDFLWAPRTSLGTLLGFAPSHHIVMENVMYGRDEAKKRGEVDWEHWDLKPTSYFFPERDIAGGALTSEATKDQLADEFHGKLLLSKKDADEFLGSLEKDVRFLAQHNVVDYSLFLIRIQVPEGTAEREAGNDASSPADQDMIPTDPPAVPPGAPSWRTGVPSADGKYLYRAVLLDFFWAKHKPQALLMTCLINTWNLLVSRSGPMSITTEADEYRERFMNMCRDFVKVEDTEVEAERNV